MYGSAIPCWIIAGKSAIANGVTFLFRKDGSQQKAAVQKSLIMAGSTLDHVQMDMRARSLTLLQSGSAAVKTSRKGSGSSTILTNVVH